MHSLKTYLKAHKWPDLTYLKSHIPQQHSVRLSFRWRPSSWHQLHCRWGQQAEASVSFSLSCTSFSRWCEEESCHWDLHLAYEVLYEVSAGHTRRSIVIIVHLMWSQMETGQDWYDTQYCQLRHAGLLLQSNIKHFSWVNILTTNVISQSTQSYLHTGDTVWRSLASIELAVLCVCSLPCVGLKYIHNVTRIAAQNCPNMSHKNCDKMCTS